MTAVQRVAQVFGWAFVVIAIWGAAVAGVSMEAELARAPRLWGLFPVNFVHNLVHLGLGLWGIRAARSLSGARSFAVGAGAIYVVLAVLGLFFPSGFGLVPIGGADIWLHAALGAALLVTGLTLSPGSEPRVEPAGTRTVMPPASSPEGTVTRTPVQPEEPEGHRKPVEPEPAGSSGAAEAAPPPKPPEHVVEEPPQQPEEQDRPDRRRGPPEGRQDRPGRDS